MKTITPPATAAAGDIRPALAALAKVVKKSVPPGPAQQHVRVDPVGRNSFRLTGNGPDTFFTAEIPGETPAKFEPFLVPMARLKDLIRGAKAHEMIALRPERNAPPTSEFPDAPKFRAAQIELGEEAKAALLRAFACASTDETRRVLQSALVEPCDNGLCRAVGTDGRHLFSSRPFELPGVKEPLVLPALKVFDSQAVRRSPSWTLGIGRSDNGSGTPFQIGGDGWCITSHLVEGNYPNYRQVIPPDREFKSRLALPPKAIPDIIHALGRMPGTRTQNRPMGIRVGKGTVSLLAREDEKSPYEEIIIPGRAEGKPTTVFLNRDYVAKALSFGLSEIAMGDAISPVKLTGEGGLMIAMPVRVQGEIEVCRSEHLGGRALPRRQKPKPQMPKPTPAMAKRKLEQKGETMPTPVLPKPSPNGGSERNPMEAAAGQIANVKEALRAAMSAVNDIAATLKATQKRQRQTEKEMRSVRHTLRSLRKVEL